MPFGKITKALTASTDAEERHGRRSKRTYRRRRKATTSNMVFKTPSAVADRMMIKLAYSDTIPIIAAGSLVDTHLFRTSQYDFDLSGTGHQPFGRDQWALFFSKYRIHSVDYVITALNNSTTHGGDLHVLAKSTSTVIANYNTPWEKPDSKHLILGPETSGSSKGTIRGTMNCAKTIGVTQEQYRTDDKTASAFGTNPATLAYLHIIGAASDGASGCNMTVRCQFALHLEYFDRVALVES